MKPDSFDRAARDLFKRQYALFPQETLEEGLYRSTLPMLERDGTQEERDLIFSKILERRFSPGGRIIAGAGTNHQNTNNCFVFSSDSDVLHTYEDVLSLVLKLAKTTKVGGGTGINLDTMSSKINAKPNKGVTFVHHIDTAHPDKQDLVLHRYKDLTLPVTSENPMQYKTFPMRAGLVLGQPISDGYLDSTDDKLVINVEDDIVSIFSAPFKAIQAIESNPKIHTVVFNWSKLRPEGSTIKGSGGTSSGAASFAIEVDNILYWYNLGGVTAGPVATLRYVFAPVLRSVRQGGTRRGAGMCTMDVYNPDVLDFLTSKDLNREESEGNISAYNISILVPDIFMIKAQELNSEESILLREIAVHAHGTGEPGLIFIDNLNKFNPLKEIRGLINKTNPCLTGDTLIAVADGRGAVSIKQLADECQDVPVFTMNKRGKPVVRWMRHARITGYNQPIYTVKFDDGLEVRVTGNHKFNLIDQSVKEAIDLQPGDSIASVTRFKATFNEAIPFFDRNSALEYMWLTNGVGDPRAEHRVIANFMKGSKLLPGEIVHHINGDSMDNSHGNLQILSRSEHGIIHGDQQQGENNGNYSGKSHEDIRAAGRQLVLNLGRGFSHEEWIEFADSQGLPKSFSNHRIEELGKVNELSRSIALELGLPIIPEGRGKARFTVRNFDLYQQALQSGFVSVRHTGNYLPIVTRACEDCGKHYEKPWSKREHAYCVPCALRRASAIGADSARLGRNRISLNTSSQQIKAFNDLKFHLGRRPFQSEWKTYCKEQSVPVRFHPGAITSYKELESRASVANHRVISVEFSGYEDVYNGTVDEFHNYYIGHHSVGEGKDRFSYVNTVQCGEIGLYNGETCDLGAINVSEYVIKDMFGITRIDFEGLKRDIPLYVQFLDKNLDYCNYPTEDSKQISQHNRRIGLGIMGFADMLVKLNMSYITHGPLVINSIMTVLANSSEAESRGMFEFVGIPGWWNDLDKESDLSDDEMEALARRNIATLTIAPTGTTSMIMGVSSGLEPIYSPFIYRKIGGDYISIIHPLLLDKIKEEGGPLSEMSEEELMSYLSSGNGSIQHLDLFSDDMKRIFVFAHDIPASVHVAVQGEAQRGMDTLGVGNSISKTINMPNEATVDDVLGAYIQASKSCKGITVYRDGSRQFQVLSTSKTESDAQDAAINSCPTGSCEVPL